MNNKKLTLLIALSITITFILLTLLGATPNNLEQNSSSSITDTTIEVQTAPQQNAVEENIKEELISSTTTTSFSTQEYPEAEAIWNMMMEWNWSEEVCAGILGNMMRECGGDTFVLNWDVNGGHGYGLCQWTRKRKSQLFKIYGKNPSIIEQLQYMKDEMEGNGITRQISEKQYQLILSSKTASQAASRFAAYFERPASKNYSRRQQNANKAYEYFKATIE